MNVLSNKTQFFGLFLISLLLFLLFLPLAYSFNVCNVDVTSPWLLVTDGVSGKDVLIVDSEGDIYLEGQDHVLENSLSEKSLVLGSMHFNKLTSKYASVLQEQVSISTDNSVVIQNNVGANVASFSNTGVIMTKGKVITESGQAGCLVDGNYCSGAIVEVRDNYCDLTGSKSGVCLYTTLGTEDCSLKLSTDTDGGINYNLAGTVTDYTGCSGGACASTSYADSCSSNTVTDYLTSGASYSTSTHDCSIANTLYCSNSTGEEEGVINPTIIWTTNYLCGSGRCYRGSNTAKTSCTAIANTYGSWSCSDISTKVRSVTTYSPTCSGGACGASTANPSTNEYVPCLAGTYCNSGSCQTITYSWQTSGFSACSQSCGPGTQTQSVVCKRDYDGFVMTDESYCNLALKPATSQSCNLGACCGNAILNSGEVCDTSNLNGNSCTTLGLGFIGGTLSCNGACTGYVTSSCTTVTQVVISTNTQYFNLATHLGNPEEPVNVEVTINSGIYVWSDDTTKAAFDTGILPSGSTVKLINKGYIMGRGGDGGGSNNGYTGKAGGNALNILTPITIDSTSGYILGGGGGGGGIEGIVGPGVPTPIYFKGGGGGAGGGNGGTVNGYAGGSGGQVGLSGTSGISGAGYGKGGGGGGRVVLSSTTLGPLGGMIEPYGLSLGGTGGGTGASNALFGSPGGIGGSGGGNGISGGDGAGSGGYTASGGGGGWGAKGGNANTDLSPMNVAYQGGLGGCSIQTNGKTITWTSGSKPSTVYGEVKSDCSGSFTYTWKTDTTWGTCSPTCGDGTQSRNVWCERNDGSVVADSFCSGVKPTTTQSCYLGSCEVWQCPEGFTWSGLSLDCSSLVNAPGSNQMCCLHNIGAGPINCIEGYLQIMDCSAVARPILS